MDSRFNRAGMTELERHELIRLRKGLTGVDEPSILNHESQILRETKSMGLIFKQLKIEGDKGSAEAETLFDTGATSSFMRREKAEKVATILPLPHPKRFELAETGKGIEVTEGIRIDFIIDGTTLSDEVFVADNLSEEFIIGASTLQKWRIKLDLENDVVILDEKAVKMKLVLLEGRRREKRR